MKKEKENVENKESEKLGRENGVVLVCTNALISGDDLLVGCFMFTKFTPMSSFAGVPLVRCSCMPWSLLIARICADLAFCFLLSGCGSRSPLRPGPPVSGLSAPVGRSGRPAVRLCRGASNEWWKGGVGP